MFHVEVEKPFIIQARSNDQSQCDWSDIENNVLQRASLDHTQFNESWMKKDFIKKV